MSKTPLVDALKQELEAKKDKLAAKLQPYRDDYEKLINDPRLIECRKMIKEINSELAPIQNELAALARADGAKGIKVEGGVFE